MTLFSKVEDRPTPPCVYNWRVYVCAAVAASAAIMIGYDSSFIGTLLSLPSFQETFGLDTLSDDAFDLVSENIVSCFQAGAFFGALAAYPTGHFLGRKVGLMINSAIFVLGAALMLGVNAQRGLGLLYAGRALAGFGTGGCSNLTPIYISELAPPAIRGRLVGLYELGWQVGGLVGFWICYGVSTTMAPGHAQWLTPFAIQLIPGGLLFIGCFYIRESPRWLMSKGRRSLALKNLCWIRQLTTEDVYMMEEVTAIDAALEKQRSEVGLGFWQPSRALWHNKKVLYRVFLGGSLFFWQNCNGINAINYYSPTVFASIGLTGTNTSLFTTGIFGVLKTVSTMVWLVFLIDKWGRRNLLIWGGIGGSLCLWYVGGYIAGADPTAHPTNGNISSAGISAMAFFYLWTICYTPTWNGTPWVLNSEMFDQNTRTMAQAFVSANNWLWNFLISRFTPQMFTSMGSGGFGVYFFFASLTLCAVVYVWFLIPETKSIPLEAMDRLFDSGVKRRYAHKIVMQEIINDGEQFRTNVGHVDLNIDKKKEAGESEEEQIEVV